MNRIKIRSNAFLIFFVLFFYSCNEPKKKEYASPEPMMVHYKKFAQALMARDLMDKKQHTVLLNDLENNKLNSILDFLPYCKHAAVINIGKIEQNTKNKSQLVGEIIKQISLIHPSLSYSNFQGSFGSFNGYVHDGGFSFEHNHKTYHSYASMGDEIPSIFNELLIANHSEYRIVVVYNDFSPYEVVDLKKDYRNFGLILLKESQIKGLYYYSKSTKVFDLSPFPLIKTANEKMNNQFDYLLKAVSGGTYYSNLEDALKTPEDVNNLDLDVESLTELGPEIKKFVNLRTLSLSSNQLTKLPPEIGSLKQLERLNLYGNKISQLPKEITNLVHLRELNLANNTLKNFPLEICNLTQLRTLHLNDNQLSTLPSTIGQLQQLYYINLSRNQLNSLPSEFFSLSNLRQAILSKNSLKELNPEISQLDKLHQLTLEDNHLEVLPSELYKLYNLTYLSLEKNKLLDLPNTINRLTGLEYLSFQPNSNLPKQEIERIKTWQKKQDERLYWSRVLIKD